MTHKEWLDNEYKQWVEALQQSTVTNFKDHPMVKRMLSDDVDAALYPTVHYLEPLLYKIDNIGRTTPKPVSGACYRMAYYALKVLDCNPKSIIEIGAGCGQFQVIIYALGYKGKYKIIDLAEVMAFQSKYISHCSNEFGFKIPKTTNATADFICSFYAYGEFDTDTKNKYLPLIQNTKHGLILFNAHSGASEQISFSVEGMQVKDEYPKSSPNVTVKEIIW